MNASIMLRYFPRTGVIRNLPSLFSHKLVMGLIIGEIEVSCYLEVRSGFKGKDLGVLDDWVYATPFRRLETDGNVHFSKFSF